MVIVFFFLFFFLETIRRRIGHRPFWVGWSQKWDSRLFTSEWSCVFSLCMFDVLKGERRRWLKMDIIFQSSVCLRAHVRVSLSSSGRFSDGHSFSWPLLCPGQCPAGTESWASWDTLAIRDSQKKRFVDKVITLLLLPLCHTHLHLLHLFLCHVPSFKCICCYIFSCQFVWNKGINAQFSGSRSYRAELKHLQCGIVNTLAANWQLQQHMSLYKVRLKNVRLLVLLQILLLYLSDFLK